MVSKLSISHNLLIQFRPSYQLEDWRAVQGSYGPPSLPQNGAPAAPFEPPPPEKDINPESATQSGGLEEELKPPTKSFAPPPQGIIF